MRVSKKRHLFAKKFLKVSLRRVISVAEAAQAIEDVVGGRVIHAVNYRTGEAAYDFKTDDEWTEEDRSTIIGTSIAGDLVLTTSGTTTSLYYGSGGKFGKKDLETNPRLKRYFWRQVK